MFLQMQEKNFFIFSWLYQNF